MCLREGKKIRQHVTKSGLRFPIWESSHLLAEPTFSHLGAATPSVLGGPRGHPGTPSKQYSHIVDFQRQSSGLIEAVKPYGHLGYSYTSPRDQCIKNTPGPQHSLYGSFLGLGLMCLSKPKRLGTPASKCDNITEKNEKFQCDRRLPWLGI